MNAEGLLEKERGSIRIRQNAKAGGARLLQLCRAEPLRRRLRGRLRESALLPPLHQRHAPASLRLVQHTEMDANERELASESVFSLRNE